MESLFVSRSVENEEVFEKINLPNQYLNDMILQNFKNIFNKGSNPVIKYIIFDLGGVYFDGDFETDFLRLVNKRISQSIPIERDQKLLLNDKLNLGEINIVEYIQKKVSRKLNKSEQDFINETWKNVWSPNDEMKDLVLKLKENSYVVTVMSNLDKENGTMYRNRGDFNIFDNELFLSYECGLLKPAKKFFEKIFDHYKIMPFEALLIDDHEKNIQVALELGMNAIKFNNTSKTKIDDLHKELKKLSINIE